MSRLQFAALAALVTGSLAGCVTYTPADAPRPATAERPLWTPEGDAREKFPETTKQLDAAESQLQARNATAAAATLADARSTFANEKKDHRLEETTGRVENRLVLLLGETELAKGDSTTALVFLAQSNLHIELAKCGALEARCEALYKRLKDDFPRIVGRGMYLDFNAYDILIDGQITVESLRVVDHTYAESNKASFFALDLMPTSLKKRADGGMDIVVDGTAMTITSTEWTTVAKVKYGDDVIELQRGHDETSHLRKSKLLGHVPAADAALLHDGGIVRVMIDRTQWKRNGDTWSAGTVRVLKVGSPAT